MLLQKLAICYWVTLISSKKNDINYVVYGNHTIIPAPSWHYNLPITTIPYIYYTSILLLIIFSLLPTYPWLYYNCVSKNK